MRNVPVSMMVSSQFTIVDNLPTRLGTGRGRRSFSVKVATSFTTKDSSQKVHLNRSTELKSRLYSKKSISGSNAVQICA